MEGNENLMVYHDTIKSKAQIFFKTNKQQQQKNNQPTPILEQKAFLFCSI